MEWETAASTNGRYFKLPIKVKIMDIYIIAFTIIISSGINIVIIVIIRLMMARGIQIHVRQRGGC